jgi:hypothetical protein
VVELPLNGRQATELILLSGAAVPSPNGGLNSQRNYPTITLSVAGGQNGGTVYLLDGGTNNDPINNLNFPIPFPDALQEFKLETGAVSARYGQHGAATVNAVTKTGGNDLHGDAFEFVRNGVFNARNAFAARRDSLKRNQYGGTLGGPILKNRLFFFGAYQGTTTRSDASSNTAFVPTQAVLNGDFTVMASNQCNASNIALKSGFVNNKIDPKLYNPVAVGYLKYLPVSSDPCGKVLWGIPERSQDTQLVGRLDYQRSVKHSIFGRYFFANFNSPYFYEGSMLTVSRAGQLNRPQSLVLGDTYLISANTISSFHGAIVRNRSDRIPVPFVTPAELGSKITTMTPGLTNLSVSGFINTSAGTANRGHFNSTTTQFAEDLDLIRRSHQISLGVNWIHSITNTTNTQSANGAFTFNGQLSGHALADFLLGLPSSFSQSNAQEGYERANYVGLYVQDTWKVNPRITFNGGLRWEPYFPMRNQRDHVSHFEMDWFLSGVKSQVYVNAPAGILFPGDPGYPGHSMTNPKLGVFAPRLGMVWDPRGNGRETIRAAFGVFNDSTHTFYNVIVANAPPWGSTTSISNPPGGFSDPWQGFPGGNPFPRPLTRDVPFSDAGQYINYPLHIRPTYTEQWNVSLQKQIGRDWALSANYLGNRTVHLFVSKGINPGVYIPGNCGTSACSTTSNIDQRRILYLANPAQGRYYGTITQLDDGGNANYNGLLLSIQRRFADRLSVLANYTLSHCLDEAEVGQTLAGAGYQDPGNRHAEYGNCGSDRRHVFNASLVAGMPKWSSPYMNRIFGGWQFSTILKMLSGSFSTVGSGRDNALTGTAQRAAQITDWHLSTPTLSAWFNKAAFAQSPTGQFGNVGRNTLSGPSSVTFDVGLTRRFTVTENQRLEFRAEAFNVLNRVNGTTLSTTLTDPQFGRVTAAADPRIMQFAVKFVF